MNKEDYQEVFTSLDLLRFILLSLLGIGILILPFQYKGDTTIVVALLADRLNEVIGDILPSIVLLLISFTGIGTILISCSKIEILKEYEFLHSLFNVSLIWRLVRVLGMIMAFLVYFKIGPEAIWSDLTGGLILYDLILGLFAIFLFGGLLLPLLTDFGLLEFVGVLLHPLMRPLFKLPGRSSINCIVSWVGDGTIGVSLTNNQFEQGYYSAREAAIISTTFSAVSITFSLLVLQQVGLTHLFGQYYLTIILAGMVAAIIMPRIPPLSKKDNIYYGGRGQDLGEVIPEGFTTWEWAKFLALKKSKNSKSLKEFLRDGFYNVLDMWLGVLPVIMCFGSIALIIAEYTSIFEFLGRPFIPLLKLLEVPYPVEASQTIMVGFADMFLPSIIGAKIPSDMTRFIVACLSVTQLVYLSEAGAVILGTKIPVSLGDLFIIFIERTLITLPVIVLCARYIFL